MACHPTSRLRAVFGTFSPDIALSLSSLRQIRPGGDALPLRLPPPFRTVPGLRRDDGAPCCPLLRRRPAPNNLPQTDPNCLELPGETVLSVQSG